MVGQNIKEEILEAYPKGTTIIMGEFYLHCYDRLPGKIPQFVLIPGEECYIFK